MDKRGIADVPSAHKRRFRRVAAAAKQKPLTPDPWPLPEPMHVLLPLLIASVGLQPPIEGRHPEAVEVFHCNFDRSWDENYDEWPDRWSRRRGPGFPHYVNVEICRSPCPHDDLCLRIKLDGGAAAIYSPAVAVSPLCSYLLEGRLKTEGLKSDRAYFSLTLLDGKRQRLETFYSEKVRETGGWKKIRLGPVMPADRRARLAVIGLHVQPHSGEDLTGVALFDDLWLGRLPRMDLKTGTPYNLFTTSETVEITCTASGRLQQHSEITFHLEDILGRKLARQQRPLTAGPAAADAEDSAGGRVGDPVERIGRASWTPPIPGPGFYRVAASMKGRTDFRFDRDVKLAVIEPRRSPAGGRFGWTLSQGAGGLPLDRLAELAAQSGINWLKYPLWYDQKQSKESIEQLIAFGERLDSDGITLVGLLSDPPLSVRERYAAGETTTAANLFGADPPAWYPSLEPLLIRLAACVRWWQLGSDTDTSFVDDPKLVEKIGHVKAQLDQIGQDVNLGIGWDWLRAMPPGNAAGLPWRSVSLSTDPSMTAGELATYLDAADKTQLRRWLVIEPLAAEHYPLEVRAADLVRRMIAARIHGADAVFCPRPFDDSCGLMHADGTPGELFLPWRTTALALGTAQYIGSIQLPQGSPNQIFARENDAVMVVWNDTPCREVLYLGSGVRQTDLWGRAAAVGNQGHRQIVSVDRLPSFVTGLNLPITRWRMDFAFDRRQIPSVFGRPHADSFRLKNHFPGGAGGEVTLVMPDIWQVKPARISLRLADGEQLQQPFQVTLPYEASSGRNKVRVDFEIQADRLHRFSVYRHIDVGLGDVYFKIATELNDRGELEVRQRLLNESHRKVSFRCQLFAPQRRRLKSQIIDLGPGEDLKTYRLADGRQLLGETLWLRAQQLDGPRILNYRFTAKK